MCACIQVSTCWNTIANFQDMYWFQHSSMTGVQVPLCTTFRKHLDYTSGTVTPTAFKKWVRSIPSWHCHLFRTCWHYWLFPHPRMLKGSRKSFFLILPSGVFGVCTRRSSLRYTTASSELMGSQAFKPLKISSLRQGSSNISDYDRVSRFKQGTCPRIPT